MRSIITSVYGAKVVKVVVDMVGGGGFLTIVLYALSYFLVRSGSMCLSWCGKGDPRSEEESKA